MTKPVKAFSLFAMVLAVVGASFGVFMENSSGDLNEILNIGSTGVEAMGALFIPISIVLLYHAFR